MKTSAFALATAGLLLIAISLAESFKTVGKTSVLQQQQDFHQEELRSQQQFEQLRQQQEQAELQIRQQNEEAHRQLALQQQAYAQQQQQQLLVPRTHSLFGFKNHHQATYSRPSLLATTTTGFERQYGPQPHPQPNPYNVPAHSTIAYLVVRPPYQQPLTTYDELGAYRSYQALANRPQPAFQQQTTKGGELHLQQATKGGELHQQQATKGGELQQTQLVEEQRPQQQELITQQQEEQRPLLGQQDEQRPIEQQPIVQQPLVQQAPQPALVVPVAKEGKLRALLEKIMSKFAHGSATYSVTSEELIYPQAPQKPLVQAPIEQQQEELPQQQQLEQQVPLTQQETTQAQDQGFGEEQQPLAKGQPAAPVAAEPLAAKTTGSQLEHVRGPPANIKGQQQDQDQLQLLQQQQSLSEQEINRQPVKGQPAQPVQQLEIKSRRPQAPQQQQQQPEAKNPNAGF